MPTWLIDRARSRVGFSVKHLVIATIHGQFRDYRGTIELDPADFTRSRFEGEIEVASIDTANADRDAQLRTNDFLCVRQFPQLRFRSERIEPAGRGAYRVTGALTVRGTTRPIALEVSYKGDGASVRLSARGVLLRKDFGLELGPVLEAGGLAIGEKVKLEVEVTLLAERAAGASLSRD
jgi:polyisoprenoid-binding protein YceI